jgi:hypothetical protein
MSWQALEALADGRQVWRVLTPLARDFQPGLQLDIAGQKLPVLRADHDSLSVIAAAPISADVMTLTGQALAIAEPQSLLLVSHDDGLFAALAWLFRHRKQVPPDSLRLLAVFSGPLPFRPQPSRYLTPMLPAHVTAALPLLDDWQIVSRIVHADGLPGCFDGEPAELIAAWQRDGDRLMTVR